MPKEKSAKVFLCYSHEDEKSKERVDAHQGGLKQSGYIELWHDRKLIPGDDWNKTIRDEFEQPDLIILTVSADFLNLPCIRSVELKRALEQHNAGDAIIVPIIIKPCYWQSVPGASIQPLSKSADFLTQAIGQEAAVSLIAQLVTADAESVSETVLIPTAQAARPNITSKVTTHGRSTRAQHIPWTT